MDAMLIDDPTLHATPLAEIAQWCDDGMYLRAQTQLPRLRASRDPVELLLAARIMSHLGADRTADALTHRVWRAHRTHSEAILSFMRQRVYRGPYEGFKWAERVSMPADAPVEIRAEYESLMAFLYSSVHDWQRAQEHFDVARALAPDCAWIWVEWAYVCDRHDRQDEAFAALDRVWAITPNSRAAVQYRAHLLIAAGRLDEGMALLEDALHRMEHGGIARDLFEVQYERGLYDAAWATLDRVEQLLPLAEKSGVAWIASRRADVAMRQGRMDVAREQCVLAGGGFYAPIAERLAQPDFQATHVHLPVGFTRQHWMTCAPATLTSIARYWGVPAEHLNIAEEICYDGTPYHSERQWAEGAGFATAEFTVDWTGARALLDAGIPFTLTTVNTASGHLQAVIGYDLARNSLLIRDPMAPTHTEFEAQSVFDSHRSSGPRGMAMVPRERADELRALPLTDVTLWDDYHRVMAALARHDRASGAEALAHLENVAPGHRLTLTSRRALANYDGDEVAGLAATEELLALYPNDVNLQLSKAASLWLIGGRAEHIEWLAQLAQRPYPDPHVLLRYADRLAEDQRRLPQAHKILQRALRYAPSDAAVWSQRASLAWQSGRTAEALPYYRIAACMQETNEDYAVAYFRACHFLGHTEEGLDFLRQRVVHLGSRAWSPTATLFQQLDMLERTPEGFAALNDALALHGDDGAFLGFCADARLRYSQPDEAERLLERAPAAQRRAAWQRARAMLDEARGNLSGAVTFARAACEMEPLNIGSQRMHASMLFRSEGRGAVVDWLRGVCERFPRNFALHQLWYEWSDPDDPASEEAVLRGIASAHPGNIWVVRELATHLTRQRRYADARPFAESALRRAPNHCESHAVMGFLELREHSYAAAVPYLKRAVELNVDADYAVSTLVGAAPNIAARREALEFIRQELIRQVTVGDGLLNFQSAAENVMPPKELLDVLRDAKEQRADLWHAWVALAVQLNDMGMPQDAMPVLDEAVERFPLLPRVHLERARACLLLGRHEDALASADAALAISPSWGRAVHMYVDILVNEGRDLGRGESIVRRALQRDRNNADMHALLGWLFERMRRFEESFDALSTSLRLDPGPRWVWDTARRVADELDRMDDIERMLDDLVGTRPGDAQAWATCAQMTRNRARAEEAAKRAIELDATNIVAWRNYLDRLLQGERFEEMERALASMPWKEAVPGALASFPAKLARERGDKEEARILMQRALYAEPNDYGLWRELADWHDADGRDDDYVAAARELVRIAPNFAPAYGYLGHALVKSRQRAEAIPSLRRAMELDPLYTFASSNLFDCAIAERDFDTAEAALAGLAAGEVTEPALVARRAALAVTRGDKDEALRLFDELLAHGDDVAPQSFDIAADAFAEAELEGQIATHTENAIRLGVCPPAAVRRLIRRTHLGHMDAALMQRLKPLLDEDKAHLLERMLLRIAGEDENHELFKQLMRRRESLRADDECWGLVAWVMLQFDEYADAIKWMGDWRMRTDPAVWALDNLSLSYFAEGDFAKAADVAAATLARDPDDIDPLIWQAADCAERQDDAGCARWLSRIDPARVPDYLEQIYGLLDAYHKVTETHDPTRAVDAFQRARKSPLHGLRRLRARLAARLVTRYARGLKAPWFWWKLGGF